MSDLGDTLRFSSNVYDEDGALADASAVALRITAPDGTFDDVAVVNPPAETGQYFYDYVTSLASPAGRYVGQWLFTFGGGNTTSYVQSFDVGPSIVSVDEALGHLRANGIIDAADDLEQLQWLCLVATEAVELDLGRVIAKRTVTETHDGSRAIVLRQTPVISVTSVSEFGTPLAVDRYVLDSSAGILYCGTTSYRTAFSAGYQNVTVVYVAGYNDPPRIVRKVALNLVQGMWQSSQQAPHPLLDESAEEELAQVTGGLNPMEMRAYDALRAPAIA